MIINFDKRGGGSGASSYADLSNKPKVNNVELSGNKTSSQLGVVEEAPNDNKQYARKDKAWVEVQGGSSSVTVEDNLNSDSSTNALSANQGKVLNGKVGDLTTTVTSMGTAVTELSGNVTDLEQQVGNKEDKNIIDSDTSTTAVSEALVVGKTYKYMPSAGVATLAFTLTAPTESDVVKFWRFKFKSGATATEFTPPSGLYWANGESLVPEANTIYEVMIDEDYCVSVLAFKQATA